MKKPLIIILVLLSSIFLAKAQDTLKHHSQPDSLIRLIPFSEGRYNSYLFTVNGKVQSPDDIKTRLLSYGPSAMEYNASKKNYTWSLISLGGVTVSGLAALIEFKHNSKYNNVSTAIINGQATFVYQHHDNAAAYIFTGAATAFLFAEIFTLIKGAQHRKRSLDRYNQQYQ